MGDTEIRSGELITGDHSSEDLTTKRLPIDRHPAIIEKPKGQWEASEFTARLGREGYSDTDIVAGLLLRKAWLDQQTDTAEDLRGSKYTLRMSSVDSIEDRLKGIVQGVRAALEKPELFKRLVGEGGVEPPTAGL